jgi:gliding motility-associated-like protein
MKFQILFYFSLVLSLPLTGQVLTCENEFILSGNATLIGECIRLTSNATSQQGCAWFSEETDFSQPFTHTMTVNFGSNNAGADGICLVYQSNSSSTCGISGEGIGAQGIANSFIVEFDTYQNGNLGDPVNDHAAININGNFASTINGPFDLGNIEDGNDHDVTFSWDPATNTYEVYFDGSLILSGVFDIINNCFGGSDMAFWGYTSSTGAEINQHTVCPGLPAEVIADAGMQMIEIPCAGALTILDGSGSDSGAEFEYEWTTSDGNIVSGEFSNTAVVDAGGTYTLTVYNNITLCESMDEVIVVVNELEAEIDIPPYLDCITGEVTLDGSNSTSGNDISYDWTTSDGNIISTNGDQATVDEPGEYTLTVTYDDGQGGFCTEETSVIVEDNPDIPEAFALDEMLTCDPPNVELDGTGSSESSVFDYEWTTTDGLILAGGNTLFPLVAAEGFYTLTVINSISGCTAEYSVYVSADQDIPDAIAIVDDELGCGNSSLVIDGSLSSFGDEFDYQWTTSNGNIIGGATEQSPEVNQPGDYTLLVTNTENGCTDETTVTVTGGGNPVVVDIAAPATLTCLTTSVTLDGTGSMPASGVTYSWTTTNGQLTGPTNQSTATATAAGNYTLIITETTSGCTNMETVSVTSNTTSPIAEAGTAIPFGCGDTSQQLNGAGSSSNNASYLWSTTNGNIISGGTTLSPLVGAAGTYTLQVTNTLNGCTATDQVIVTGDDDTPVVQIILNDTLDCVTNTLVLNAAGSTSGMDYNQVWSTANGQFVSGTNGLQPIVDQPGTYTLTISDITNGCSNSASVTVVQDTLRPTAAILTPEELNCQTTSLVLNGMGSSQGVNIQYAWSTANGQITSATDTSVATIDAPGDYQLLVENTVNNCVTTATVAVTENVIPPDLFILPIGELTCLQEDMTITASLGTPFPNPDFQWSTLAGNISGSDSTAQILATSTGTYSVTVVNPANQCSSTSSIQLTENIATPVAAAGTDQNLDCILTTLALGGNSSSGSSIAYTWSSPNATLPALDSIATLDVSAPGTYVLEVLDESNGCFSIDTVLVTQDIELPTAMVALPPQLTCTDSLSLLDGSASVGTSALLYSWTTLNGSFVGDPSAAQVNAGQAGTYQLVVTNTINGCTDTTATMVTQDDNFPQASIAMPLSLTCGRLSVNLAGTANSNSGNTSFSWTTANGNIVQDANTLQPLVDSPGTYTLTVEDTNNNCRAQAEIQVLLDNTPPIVDAGLDTLLNCSRTQLQLFGTANAQGAGVTYAWSTLDGNVLNGANTATPLINAAGTYLLEITNTTNECLATDQVMVSLDTISPVIQISPPSLLTCAVTTASLDATASMAGNNPLYSWTNASGLPITNEDQVIATITQAGDYQLLLTNTDNGCSQTATIAVQDDLTPPVPLIAEPDTLDCITLSVGLDATGSTGNSLSYAWANTDGNPITNSSTATPAVSQSGNYDLLLTDNGNGCTATASIFVEEDTDTPLVAITSPITVDCNNPSIQLQGNIGSNVGNTPMYSWTTANGSILQDANTLTPTVDQGGNYTLMVTNTDNGCVGSRSILVREDLDNPVIVIEPLDTLNCTVLSLDIIAENSTGTSSLSYAWESPDGNILTPDNEANITVNAPGSYGLLLTNLTNGCTDSLGVTVAQDTIQPVVMIGMPGILDCATPSLILDASASSSGSDLTINWSTINGQIDAGADGLLPEISQPGSYILEIINTANTCSNTASVDVSQDDDVPVIIFATPEELNCLVASTPLDATASSMGANLVYSWATANGMILSGADGLTPQVGAPGTYVLTIEDTSNNCVNTANVVVQQDITPPQASAGNDFVLDCTEEQDNLDGTNSSQGSNFIYLWTSNSGTTVLNENTLLPTISAPGNYQLLVTNTSNGCTATDLVTVTENIPTATLEAVQPLCFDDLGLINFSSIQGGTPPYLYSIDNGNSLQSQTLFASIPAGVYQALVEDSNGCTFEESIEIIQPDSLYVLVTRPEVEIHYGDSVRLIAQTNFPEASLAQIQWEDASTLSCGDCLTPYAQPTETSVYQISVISENGCSDKALVRVFVNRQFPVYFPNIFSPNGDGDNDLFYPFAELGSVTKIHQFDIFDRWGNAVYTVQHFAANDPRYGWDGTNAGVKMNPAVFVYFAEIEFADGRVEIFKGDVTLIR